jgi:cell division protein ZapA
VADRRGNVTQVEIYGQTYTVRADSDASYVRELARYVDGKMREVAERAATVDSAKIAILAALNISDDLYQREKRGQGDPSNARARAERLIKKLDDALGAH